MIYILTIANSNRTQLINKLKKFNLEFKIVYGIDGREVDIPNRGILKNTVKACALGHLKIIKLFSETKDENCFIFEDDFELQEKDIAFLTGDMKNYLASKYDLVQLTSIDNIEMGRYEFLGLTLIKYKFLFGLTSYLLSKEGADKILKNIKDPSYHIDYLIGKYVNFISIDNRFSQKIELKSLAQTGTGNNNLLKNTDLGFILNLSCCNYINLLTIILIGIILSSIINKIPLLMLFSGLIVGQF